MRGVAEKLKPDEELYPQSQVPPDQAAPASPPAITLPGASPEDRLRTQIDLWLSPPERAAYSDRQRMNAQMILSERDWVQQNHPNIMRLPILPASWVKNIQRGYEQYREQQMGMAELSLRQDQGQRVDEGMNLQRAGVGMELLKMGQEKDPQTLEHAIVEAFMADDMPRARALTGLLSDARGHGASDKTEFPPPNTIDALLARQASAGQDTTSVEALAKRMADMQAAAGGTPERPPASLEAGIAAQASRGDAEGVEVYQRLQKKSLKAKEKISRRGAQSAEKEEPLLSSEKLGSAGSTIDDEFTGNDEKEPGWLKKVQDAPAASEDRTWPRADKPGKAKVALEALAALKRYQALKGEAWSNAMRKALKGVGPSMEEIAQAARAGEITAEEHRELLQALYPELENAETPRRRDAETPRRRDAETPK